MAWFRVDDQFGDHPKVRAIPRNARRNTIGLWTLAGTWCAHNVTTTEAQDGNVPGYMVEELCCDIADAEQLVRVGLWHAHGHDCDACDQPRDPNGFIFHQWDSLQYTREQTLEKRANDAERQRASRARRKASQDSHNVTDTESAAVRATRPDPTRPDHQSLTQGGQRTETLHDDAATMRPEEARCAKHEGNPDPPACRGCMRAREKAELAGMRARQIAEREAEQRRRGCQRCGGSGLIEDAEGRPTRQKCDHTKPPTLEVVR